MFKINVKTLRNDVLKYTNVKSYEVVDGFLVFEDSKTGEVKRFSTSNVEIEEMGDQQ